VLRFMEERFGVAEPNISPWRRAVCGDLTSAFDFAVPDPSHPAAPLPGTQQFAERVARSKAGTAIAIPAVQTAAQQMPGQRGHRALPYRFAVQGTMTGDGKLRIAMDNSGTVGAALSVHDMLHGQDPWHFTIGANHSHAHDDWQGAAVSGRFDLMLYGPNGFLRRFAGGDGDMLDVLLHERADLAAAELVFTNRGSQPVFCTVALDPAYRGHGERARRIALAPGATSRGLWRLERSDYWYDLTVEQAASPGFVRRFAGKVESGKPGRTDPAIGAMRFAPS
jgi:phospholipase C